MTLYLLTVDQVAEALQCARDTAERAMREGDLPGLQYGRTWVVPRGF